MDPEVKNALALTNRIYARLNARRSDIEKYERYHAGDQKLTFATDEWLKANGARYAGFSDNWCATIANSEAERLTPTGIKYRDDDKSTIGTATWDDWLRNEMDSQASQGILTSLIAKRSFVSVWSADSDGTPQYAWEHPSNVEIEYDWMNPRLRTAALKTWIDETHEFAILSTADFIFKFRRARYQPQDARQAWSKQSKTGTSIAEGGWEPFQGKDDVWPAPNPLGAVPVVEIPNRPMLRGEPISEIASVIPMQDAINLLWAYLFLAADYASMPARVLLGTTPPLRQILDKATGEVTGTSVVTMKELNEARFATFSGENAKIDQWDAASLAVFTDVIEIAVGHIAAQTRTPPHYLVTNKGISNLAAEALKAAETGLVKKSLEFQTFASPGIREVHRLGHLVRGNDELARATQLATATWQNPEIRSEAQLADSLVKKKSIGYPRKWLFELDGVSPGDMVRIQKYIEEEREEAIEASVQALVEQDTGGTFDGGPEVDSRTAPNEAA